MQVYAVLYVCLMHCSMFDALQYVCDSLCTFGVWNRLLYFLAFVLFG